MAGYLPHGGVVEIRETSSVMCVIMCLCMHSVHVQSVHLSVCMAVTSPRCSLYGHVHDLID